MTSHLCNRALVRGLALLVLLAGGSGIVLAQEDAVIKRATQLRASPADSATSVADLAVSTTVTRTTQRQGAWIQVRSPSGAVGWVHMFDIGTPARENAAAGALRNISSTVDGSGSVNVATATVGIRGLGEGDVSRSSGSTRFAAAGGGLREVASLRESPENARAFAAKAALQARSAETLPAPALPAPDSAAAPVSQAAADRGGVLGGLLQSVNGMTETQEAELGRQMAAQLLQGKPLDPTPELQRYVNSLGRWISLQSSRPGLPWTFVVVDESDFNAYSAPGGYVVVTRGLVDRCTDEAELAGILAHEIAHVVNKHHLHAMRAAALTGAAASPLSVLIRHVNTRGYGAEAEHLADREAVVLAARAGLDPFGLVSVLVQVNALDDSDLQFADAHPQSRLRLDHLEQAMAHRLDPLVDAKAAVSVEQRLALMVAK